ncbi:MAG: hypothetical protein E7320_06185 [Clostridiales bacterium]|nr:hypothetical protein [Clostridiales bacterium]
MMQTMGMLYKMLRGMVRLFSRKWETVWEEPFDGELAVFCPNHAGAMGPIRMCAHFELTDSCYSWMNNGMMEAKEVPAYVRQDYWWEPGCKLEPLYNATLPYIAAAIIPPILRSAPGIPVYHDARVLKTFRQSIERMKEGNHMIIFTEQPAGHGTSEGELNSGWLQIAPMAWRIMKVKLKIYPVNIDLEKRRISVAKPVQYDPEIPLREQQETILSAIKKGISTGQFEN